MASPELPYGLQAVTDEMPPEERCTLSKTNMQHLIDLGDQARLALGEELAALKKSGDWRAHPQAGKCRTWDLFVCTMQWPNPDPLSSASMLTPRAADRLIDGFKDHLLHLHLRSGEVS